MLAKRTEYVPKISESFFHTAIQIYIWCYDWTGNSIHHYLRIFFKYSMLNKILVYERKRFTIMSSSKILCNYTLQYSNRKKRLWSLHRIKIIYYIIQMQGFCPWSALFLCSYNIFLLIESKYIFMRRTILIYV